MNERQVVPLAVVRAIGVTAMGLSMPFARSMEMVAGAMGAVEPPDIIPVDDNFLAPNGWGGEVKEVRRQF